MRGPVIPGEVRKPIEDEVEVRRRRAQVHETDTRAGFTFGTWRLLTAVARLSEGEAVTTVAYDLGYESPGAFSAMFRRSLGAPPVRYLRGGPAATPS